MNMNAGLVFNVTMDEYFRFVAKWLENPTSIMEVVGSILTRNSEIFSVVPSTVAKQPAFITIISLVVKWKKLVTFATVFGVLYCWPGF